MFRKFRSMHMQSNQKENQDELERAMARSAQWDQLLGQRGYRGETIFPHVYPSLLTILDIPCAEASDTCVRSWNDMGDKLNWDFVDMAMCWGRVHGAAEARPVDTKPQSIVSQVVELFKKEGSIPATGCMPVLPALER